MGNTESGEEAGETNAAADLRARSTARPPQQQQQQHIHQQQQQQQQHIHHQHHQKLEHHHMVAVSGGVPPDSDSDSASPFVPPETDLSHLTQEEREQIAKVLSKAKELQVKEEERIRELENEFSSFSETVTLRASLAGDRNLCPICHMTEVSPVPTVDNQTSALPSSSSSLASSTSSLAAASALESYICSDCKRRVCNKCGNYGSTTTTRCNKNQGQLWLCHICQKRRHLATSSGLWHRQQGSKSASKQASVDEDYEGETANKLPPSIPVPQVLQETVYALQRVHKPLPSLTRARARRRPGRTLPTRRRQIFSPRNFENKSNIQDKNISEADAQLRLRGVGQSFSDEDNNNRDLGSEEARMQASTTNDDVSLNVTVNQENDQLSQSQSRTSPTERENKANLDLDLEETLDEDEMQRQLLALAGGIEGDNGENEQQLSQKESPPEAERTFRVAADGEENISPPPTTAQKTPSLTSSSNETRDQEDDSIILHHSPGAARTSAKFNSAAKAEASADRSYPPVKSSGNNKTASKIPRAKSVRVKTTDLRSVIRHEQLFQTAEEKQRGKNSENTRGSKPGLASKRRLLYHKSASLDSSSFSREEEIVEKRSSAEIKTKDSKSRKRSTLKKSSSLDNSELEVVGEAQDSPTAILPKEKKPNKRKDIPRSESLSDSEIKGGSPKHNKGQEGSDNAGKSASNPRLLVSTVDDSATAYRSLSGSSESGIGSMGSSPENEFSVLPRHRRSHPDLTKQESPEEKYRSVEDLTKIGLEEDSDHQPWQKPVGNSMPKRRRSKPVMEMPLSPIWDVGETATPQSEEPAAVQIQMVSPDIPYGGELDTSFQLPSSQMQGTPPSPVSLEELRQLSDSMSDDVMRYMSSEDREIYDDSDAEVRRQFSEVTAENYQQYIDTFRSRNVGRESPSELYYPARTEEVMDEYESLESYPDDMIEMDPFDGGVEAIDQDFVPYPNSERHSSLDREITPTLETIEESDEPENLSDEDSPEEVGINQLTADFVGDEFAEVKYDSAEIIRQLSAVSETAADFEEGWLKPPPKDKEESTENDNFSDDVSHQNLSEPELLNKTPQETKQIKAISNFDRKKEPPKSKIPVKHSEKENIEVPPEKIKPTSLGIGCKQATDGLLESPVTPDKNTKGLLSRYISSPTKEDLKFLAGNSENRIKTIKKVGVKSIGTDMGPSFEGFLVRPPPSSSSSPKRVSPVTVDAATDTADEYERDSEDESVQWIPPSKKTVVSTEAGTCTEDQTVFYPQKVTREKGTGTDTELSSPSTPCMSDRATSPVDLFEDTLFTPAVIATVEKGLREPFMRRDDDHQITGDFDKEKTSVKTTQIFQEKNITELDSTSLPTSPKKKVYTHLKKDLVEERKISSLPSSPSRYQRNIRDEKDGSSESKESGTAKRKKVKRRLPAIPSNAVPVQIGPPKGGQKSPPKEIIDESNSRLINKSGVVAKEEKQASNVSSKHDEEDVSKTDEKTIPARKIGSGSKLPIPKKTSTTSDITGPISPSHQESISRGIGQQPDSKEAEQRGDKPRVVEDEEIFVEKTESNLSQSKFLTRSEEDIIREIEKQISETSANEYKAFEPSEIRREVMNKYKDYDVTVHEKPVFDTWSIEDEEQVKIGNKDQHQTINTELNMQYTLPVHETEAASLAKSLRNSLRDELERATRERRAKLDFSPEKKPQSRMVYSRQTDASKDYQPKYGGSSAGMKLNILTPAAKRETKIADNRRSKKQSHENTVKVFSPIEEDADSELFNSLLNQNIRKPPEYFLDDALISRRMPSDQESKFPATHRDSLELSKEGELIEKRIQLERREKLRRQIERSRNQMEESARRLEEIKAMRKFDSTFDKIQLSFSFDENYFRELMPMSSLEDNNKIASTSLETLIPRTRSSTMPKSSATFSLVGMKQTRAEERERERPFILPLDTFQKKEIKFEENHKKIEKIEKPSKVVVGQYKMESDKPSRQNQQSIANRTVSSSHRKRSSQYKQGDLSSIPEIMSYSFPSLPMEERPYSNTLGMVDLRYSYGSYDERDFHNLRGEEPFWLNDDDAGEEEEEDDSGDEEKKGGITIYRQDSSAAREIRSRAIHPNPAYNFEFKSVYLSRDPREKSVKGNGLGMRIVGGKRIPGTDDTAAYISAIYPGGAAEQVGDLREGHQVLEWCGIRLTNKTYEDVGAIIKTGDGEVELKVRCDTKIVKEKSRPRFSSIRQFSGDSYQSSFEQPSKEMDDKEDLVGIDPRLLSKRLEGISENRSNSSSSYTQYSPSKWPNSPQSVSTPQSESPTPQESTPHRGNRERRKEITGEIQLQMSYDRRSEKLVINIIQARGLAPKDHNGFADPFVKVCLLPGRSSDNKRRTKYVTRNLNPEWNQTVMYENLPPQELPRRRLEFNIWDYDRFVSNDFMGEILIDLVDMRCLDNRPRWFKLRDHIDNSSSKLHKPKTLIPVKTQTAIGVAGPPSMAPMSKSRSHFSVKTSDSIPLKNEQSSNRKARSMTQLDPAKSDYQKERTVSPRTQKRVTQEARGNTQADFAPRKDSGDYRVNDRNIREVENKYRERGPEGVRGPPFQREEGHLGGRSRQAARDLVEKREATRNSDRRTPNVGVREMERNPKETRGVRNRDRNYVEGRDVREETRPMDDREKRELPPDTTGRELREPRDHRNAREFRDPRDPRDPKNPRDPRDPRDSRPRDLRGPRDIRQDLRDSSDTKGARGPRDQRDHREGRISRDPRDKREYRGTRETISRENRDTREIRERERGVGRHRDRDTRNTDNTKSNSRENRSSRERDYQTNQRHYQHGREMSVSSCSSSDSSVVSQEIQRRRILTTCHTNNSNSNINSRYAAEKIVPNFHLNIMDPGNGEDNHDEFPPEIQIHEQNSDNYMTEEILSENIKSPIRNKMQERLNFFPIQTEKNNFPTVYASIPSVSGGKTDSSSMDSLKTSQNVMNQISATSPTIHCQNDKEITDLKDKDDKQEKEYEITDPTLGDSTFNRHGSEEYTEKKEEILREKFIIEDITNKKVELNSPELDKSSKTALYARIAFGDLGPGQITDPENPRQAHLPGGRSSQVQSAIHSKKVAADCVGEIMIGLRKESKADGDVLYVEVVKCRKLKYKFKSSDRLPDLYVKSYLIIGNKRNHKQKTRLQKNQLEPVFNHVIMYNITFKGVALQVALCADGGRFGRNIIIGEANIWLDNVNFLEGEVCGWYKLFQP